MEATVSKTKVKRKSEKLTIGRIVLIVLLTFLALVTLIPFFWMLSASFKTNNEVFTVPIQWVPKTWHPENYSVIWDRIPLLTFSRIQLF